MFSHIILINKSTLKLAWLIMIDKNYIFCVQCAMYAFALRRRQYMLENMQANSYGFLYIFKSLIYFKKLSWLNAQMVCIYNVML